MYGAVWKSCRSFLAYYIPMYMLLHMVILKITLNRSIHVVPNIMASTTGIQLVKLALENFFKNSLNLRTAITYIHKYCQNQTDFSFDNVCNW